MTISFEELKRKPITYTATNTRSKATVDTSPITESDNTKNMQKKLILALSGLAVLGATAIYIYKGGKSDNAVIDYAKENILNFADCIKSINKLSKEKRTNFEQASSTIFRKLSKIQNYVKTPKENITILQFLTANKKVKINSLPSFPNFVYMTGIEDDFAKSMTNILADVYEAKFKSRKYTQGYAKEFIEMMKELAQKTKAEEKTTFIHFENLGTLIDDINKPENKELLSEFKAIISANKDNNIVYFVNKNLNHELYPRKQINLEFMNSATSSAFKEELEQLADKGATEKSQLESDIIKELSVFMHKIDAYSIATNSDQNILLLNNSQGNLIDSLLERLTYITEDSHKKIITDGTIKDLVKNIKEEITKAQEYFTRTQNKTFVTIDNLETLLSKSDINAEEFKELSELFKTIKDNHITIVLPHSNSEKIKQLLSNNQFVKNVAFDKENLREYFFNYEALGKNGESFKQRLNMLSQLIDIEKSGQKMNNGNGIFLYGNAEKIDKAEMIIKNTLDVNFQELIYDPKQPFESIKKLVEIAEKCEADYPTTRKRTMIKLVDWEKLLTDEESQESRRMLGKFKQFVEHCSERYHTTVLLKTTRAMEEFEDASIASHRFETQFKLI